MKEDNETSLTKKNESRKRSKLFKILIVFRSIRKDMNEWNELSKK